MHWAIPSTTGELDLQWTLRYRHFFYLPCFFFERVCEWAEARQATFLPWTNLSSWPGGRGRVPVWSRSSGLCALPESYATPCQKLGINFFFMWLSPLLTDRQVVEVDGWVAGPALVLCMCFKKKQRKRGHAHAFLILSTFARILFFFLFLVLERYGRRSSG